MSQSDGWLLTVLLVSVGSLFESKVFLEQRHAVQLLRGPRRPRANFFLEEMMPGNLERECYEETCSQEEAAEIFQTKEKTMEFWYRYKNLNPCHYNPCKNGGICTIDRDGYLCLCPPRYDGKTCAIEVFECQFKNGGCLHYCTNQERTTGVQCSCAEGYQLDEDGKTCSETVAFPCGKKQSEASLRRSLLDESVPFTPTFRHSDMNLTITTEGERNSTSTLLSINSTQPGGNSTEYMEDVNEETRIVGGQLERQGGSPWQVMLCREDGYGFCGGTLISQRWVVSSAHCMHKTPDHVTIGDYDKQRPDPDEQKIKVAKVVVHPHFHDYTFDSDIALVYLSSPVVLSPVAVPACLPNGQLASHLQREDVRGMVTGWGATQYLGHSSRFLRKVTLPVVDQQKCIGSTEQVITDNMFCAGYLEASLDACSGDSGGPFVVNYRGTWFLTGVVSWGEKCTTKGKYGIYTRLGNYLHWIQDTIERQVHNSTHK
ncbi:coagulation factor X-like [Oncorhynchus kisutch]|uniref:Coagulation factor X-like n=1 Tax=Oncorhynchus kisutch TaxID=8019 RepID=A0A8C7F564_ONCKI|nr:coagulation factor X-like [Oncorhynchus kisutch]